MLLGRRIEGSIQRRENEREQETGERRKKEWQKGFPIHFSYFALLVFPLSHFTLEMYVELICKW